VGFSRPCTPASALLAAASYALRHRAEAAAVGDGSWLSRFWLAVAPQAGRASAPVRRQSVAQAEYVASTDVTWGEALEGSARDLLAQPEEEEEAGRREGATEFLRDVLGEGPTPVKTVQAEANGQKGCRAPPGDQEEGRDGSGRSLACAAEGRA
jgi:hypothetical protein